MEDYYTSLVTQVLEHQPLAHIVRKIHNGGNSRFLNLVIQTWERDLTNSAIYNKLIISARDCFTHAPTRKPEYNFMNMRPTFPLMVVANCRFLKNFEDKEGGKCETALSIQECEPLHRITTAMHSDLRLDKINLRYDGKFVFDNCTTKPCDRCSLVRQRLLECGYTADQIPSLWDTYPCGAITNVYNGKEVVGTLASELRNVYPDTFLALLVLEIRNRYTFLNKVGETVGGTSHRIRGKVYYMVAFDEGKLYDIGSFGDVDAFPVGSLLSSQGDDGEDRKVVLPSMETAPRRPFVDPPLNPQSSRSARDDLETTAGGKRRKVSACPETPCLASGQGSGSQLLQSEEELMKSLVCGEGASSARGEPKDLKEGDSSSSEGESDEEEIGCCTSNVIEAFPSTFHKQSTGKLVAKESFQNII